MIASISDIPQEEIPVEEEEPKEVLVLDQNPEPHLDSLID